MLAGVRCREPGTMETPSIPVGRTSADGIAMESGSNRAATLSDASISRVAVGSPEALSKARLGVVVD